MTAGFEIRPIAHLESDLGEKFGVPRQAGVVEELEGRIVFEPPYRNPDALRGIEGFSHLWLIWQFSKALGREFSPTVRPPRLGGNERVGVFATRSPFRPNALGLSCVRLLRVERDETRGPVLVVGGADLVDGTPIFDVKPYLPYADCRPETRGGRWRWPLRRGRRSESRKKSAPRCAACWQTTPGPGIRTTRSASTASALRERT